MTDVLTPQQRRLNMSRIKGRNTKPELLVRRFLHSKGLRFRVHAKNLPGSPDIILPKRRTVVFVHGCFWHRHPSCPYAVIPRTRRAFWKEKLLQNRRRDLKNQADLARLGWKVEVIWTCEIGLERLEELAECLLNRGAAV